MRGMAGPGGVVHEEGLVRRVDMRILDELDGFIGQVDAQVVALFWRTGRFHGVVIVGQLGEPLVGFAAQEAVEALEAAAERPAVETDRLRSYAQGVSGAICQHRRCCSPSAASFR